MDVQKVVAGILEKVAAKKEEEKKVEKKEEKKDIVKGMSSCKYAYSIADALDEISDNFEYNFGSELDKAQKLAFESPNTLPRSTATGVNFKDKNEHRDAMAVGEDPAMGDRGNENGITPNHLKTTLSHPPGGKEKNDPANPPLYNKTADTYQKILKKLAGDKTAYESPNALRTMTVTDSGAGQQGYDSGKSDGNNLRNLIQTSNEKAMDYTKADAKKDYIKEQMSQVFDEVHPEKDTAVDRFIDRGADTSKLAGIKDIASKAKDVASRGVELAKGGKHIGTSEGARRAGNTSAGFLNKAPRGEAVKSTAVRAGLAGAAGATGYGAHKAMSKKADEETVSKMEKLVKEEKKDEKVEEKLHPGIHKEVAKEENRKEAGIQDIAGHALGGLAGAATKAHELGKGALQHVKGLGVPVGSTLLGAGAGGAGAALGGLASGELGQEGSTLPISMGGALGSIPGAALIGSGHPLMGVPLAALGAAGGAYLGGKGSAHLAGREQEHSTKEAQVISKLASILLSYKTAGSKEAGLREDLAGRALGGLAGAATKAHQMGSGAVNFVKQHPKALLGAGAGLAGLTAAGYGLDKVTEPVREAVQEKIESKIGPWDRLGAGANLGGLAGAVPGMALMSKSPEAGLAAAVGGGLLGGIGGQYLENKLRGRTPEEQVVSKLASILASYKTAGSEGALGDGSAVAPGGMDVGQAVPQETSAPAAGTPEQIEKLKKILLMMQLKKQQEEAAMAQAQQGNMQVPPEMTAQTSPGAVQGI